MALLPGYRLEKFSTYKLLFLEKDAMGEKVQEHPFVISTKEIAEGLVSRYTSRFPNRKYFWQFVTYDIQVPIGRRI